MGHISTRIVDGLHDAAMKSAFDRWERDICYPLTSYAVNQSLGLRLSPKHGVAQLSECPTQTFEVV
jgi:hypothetical protein